MMAVIETKFGLGDVVWYANTTTEKRKHPCPDCLGSRKWEARSPAGGAFEVECPRCSSSYISNRSLGLEYAVHTPYARPLTIGLVQPNGNTWDEGRPTHRYMCLETGVGSGSVYDEVDLFASEAEAMAAAETKAALNNADPAGWVAKQYSETAKFCDYQLKDAAIAAAESRASALGYRVEYLIEDLKEAESLTEVKERIERWGEA